MKAVLGLMLALAAAPAVAADQFDLVCKGEAKTYVLGEASPVEARYRVDLKAGRWCKDECAITQPIHAVEDWKIEFLSHPAANEGERQEMEWVDRRSGAWSVSSITANDLRARFYSASGTCTPAAFSSFPVVKSRF